MSKLPGLHAVYDPRRVIILGRSSLPRDPHTRRDYSLALAVVQPDGVWPFQALYADPLGGVQHFTRLRDAVAARDRVAKLMHYQIEVGIWRSNGLGRPGERLPILGEVEP